MISITPQKKVDDKISFYCCGVCWILNTFILYSNILSTEIQNSPASWPVQVRLCSGLCKGKVLFYFSPYCSHCARTLDWCSEIVDIVTDKYK